MGISLLIWLVELLPHIANHRPHSIASESRIIFDLFQIALAQRKRLHKKHMVGLVLLLTQKFRIVQLPQVDFLYRIEFLLTLRTVKRMCN